MNRLFLYIYTILYIPGFHVCDYNAQVMEVHIESYFWSWTAFCVWEILSENRKMSSSSGWRLLYRRIKFFIFYSAYLLYVVCIYIRLPLLGWIMSCHAWQDCRIWFVGKPDSRDDVTSLGAAHRERPAQGREDTLYNNIPCIQKYQHVFFLKKKMFPRLVTDEKEIWSTRKTIFY